MSPREVPLLNSAPDMTLEWSGGEAWPFRELTKGP